MNVRAIHSECGKTAFFVDRMPIFGEPISTRGVRTLDGSEPKPLSLVCCGSCGEALKTKPIFEIAQP